MTSLAPTARSISNMSCFVPSSTFFPRSQGVSQRHRSRCGTGPHHSVRPVCPPRAAADGPVLPEGFKLPEPRRGYMRPESAAGLLTRGVGMALRAGAGVGVLGYAVRRRDGKLEEYSTVLPDKRPAKPLVLFEFESCPSCRKVREALCMLDLDVLIKPCPRGGTAFRNYVKNNFGKAQFPYLIDPNTDFAGYESADIVNYLFSTYGGSVSRPPFIVGPVGGSFSFLPTLTSAGRGIRREVRVVPAPKPLELWAYEPSPFCRVVRERLCELEIPYTLRPTPRGSPNRKTLKEVTGIIQVPYLVDPNTNIAMFESAEIVTYLTDVYGPSAPGAVEDPSNVYLSTEFEEGSAETPSTTVKDMELNPEEPTDPALESYCETAPEADECRTYDN